MYTITRKNRIKEQLQLCHADGTVAVALDVDLNVDEIAGRVNKTYSVFKKECDFLQAYPNDPEAMERFGKAVFALFEVIFTEAGAKRIVEFYEGHYTEMLLDLFPFINDEIMPKIQNASEDRKAQLLAAAKKARKSMK
jgi:hypothetical protein